MGGQRPGLHQAKMKKVGWVAEDHMAQWVAQDQVFTKLHKSLEIFTNCPDIPMKMRKVQWVTKDQVFLTWEAEDRQVLVILLVRQVAPPAPAQWVAQYQVFTKLHKSLQIFTNSPGRQKTGRCWSSSWSGRSCSSSQVSACPVKWRSRYQLNCV